MKPNGEKHGSTYLEIYSIPNDSNERITHRLLYDEDAYDTWHLSLYMKEILEYRRLLAAETLTLEALPRKEKNLLLYLVLSCCPQAQTVVEIGSSLFEMIDGLELVDKFIHNASGDIPAVNIKQLQYVGIEISDILRQASTVLHPNHNIKLLFSVADAQSYNHVLYDGSVVNYAFKTARAAADFINLAQVALLNIFVSKGETFLFSRLGKASTYFSLEELVYELDKPLYHLFGEKAPGPYSGHELSRGKPVVEGFFLCCSAGFVDRFMEVAERNVEIKAYFDKKQIKPKEALTLL